MQWNIIFAIQISYLNQFTPFTYSNLTPQSLYLRAITVQINTNDWRHRTLVQYCDSCCWSKTIIWYLLSDPIRTQYLMRTARLCSEGFRGISTWAYRCVLLLLNICKQNDVFAAYRTSFLNIWIYKNLVVFAGLRLVFYNTGY